jgi:hypothetical protein
MATRRKRGGLANLSLPGLIDPQEYAFETEFLGLAEHCCGHSEAVTVYMELEIRKVLGLARAYARLLQRHQTPLVKQIARPGTAVDSDSRR